MKPIFKKIKKTKSDTLVSIDANENIFILSKSGTWNQLNSKEIFNIILTF